MSTPAEWLTVPEGLPVPVDDGLTDHLPGFIIPESLILSSTDTKEASVDLAALSRQAPVLLFAYPRTGEPGVPNPDGWDDIPGARGCTPELCGVRDSVQPLLSASPNLRIFGLSTQTTEYQNEVVTRLHLPFPILSDADFKLTRALRLPTFEAAGMELMKRFTLLLVDGRVKWVDYPVFPSNTAAARALKLLEG